VIKKNLFERDVQGNIDCNAKKLADLLKVQQQIVSLYQVPVEKLNFYNSKTSVTGIKKKGK